MNGCYAVAGIIHKKNLIKNEMDVNRVILSLLILFSFQHVHAQLKDTFEKGFIITNENVGIDGYIKTNDLSNLSTEICFKLAETDVKFINYNTTQIKSFQTLTGKIFDLFSIKINNRSTEITVFANRVLQGETSLYKTIYKSTTFYIVVTKDENYVLQDDELIPGETKIKKYQYQGVLNIATKGFLKKKHQKIAFRETDFIKIISEYNTSKGYESKEVAYNEKNIHYFIVNIGGGYKKDVSELFFQAMYRLYYPKISRSTSLNFGLNYFSYQSSEPSNADISGFKESLISIPCQFQQNLLNKNIRPYVFGGISLSYFKVVDDKNNPLLEDGLQKSFGIGALYGAGIEIDLFKGIMLKSEFRSEIFTHLILFGIAYNFSK